MSTLYPVALARIVRGLTLLMVNNLQMVGLITLLLVLIIWYTSCCAKRQTLFHYGPMIALGLTGTITVAGITAANRLLPFHTIAGQINLLVFLTIVAGIVFCLFSAVHLGGGRIPKGWRPANPADEKFLQYCKICEGFKAPRSHHCQSCGYCVAKMDHHCPWVNSCVGNRNHVAFLGFVALVPLGCSYATVLCFNYAYYNAKWIRRAYYLSKHQAGAFNEVILVFVGFVLAIAVTIAVGILLYFQLRGILQNTTQIEEWIIEKAENRDRKEKFVFPYHLGSMTKNFNEVINRGLRGDGIEWTVAENCNQFTLTIEQLKQKQAKRAASRLFQIKTKSDPVRGLSFGWWVWFQGPWPGSNRISVKEGDNVLVWSKSKSWYYGEKGEVVGNKFEGVKPRERGWFPVDCVDTSTEPVTEDEIQQNTETEKKELKKETGVRQRIKETTK
eukprot:m.339924 g.339924  ORF g.339924 m.339924 type:complete len:444 (+) comp19041_c0_seq1:101-1432(+)